MVPSLHGVGWCESLCSSKVLFVGFRYKLVRNVPWGVRVTCKEVDCGWGHANRKLDVVVHAVHVCGEVF